MSAVTTKEEDSRRTMPEDAPWGHFMHNFQNPRGAPWSAGYLSSPRSAKFFNGSEHSDLMVPSFNLPDRLPWTSWLGRQTWPWSWGPIPGGTSSWRPSLSVQVRGSQDGHSLCWEEQEAPEKQEHRHGNSSPISGRTLVASLPSSYPRFLSFHWVTLEDNCGGD